MNIHNFPAFPGYFGVETNKKLEEKESATAETQCQDRAGIDGTLSVT